MHDVGDCWRKDAVDIAAKTRLCSGTLKRMAGLGVGRVAPVWSAADGMPAVAAQPGGSGWRG